MENFKCSPSEGLFSLPLSPVSVDASDGETLPEEEVVQLISSLLSLNKHECSAGLDIQD